MREDLWLIDHFGFYNTKTFKQRYLIADKYWKTYDGVILFYTGNEGDITWFSNHTGFMWDVAEKLKALLVFAEYRYYGESLPFGGESYKDSKHLNFLTSEQALADFAELIRHLKRTVPGADSQPVIAVGGSYGGVLAAWFRMKYPHLVIGALAASAPIWQFEELTPCGVLMKIVTEDFKKGGIKCSESILRSWGAINWLSNMGQTRCNNISETTIGNWGSRVWGYQTCTEIILPFCTNGVDDMFEPRTWDLDKYSDDCYKQWGVRSRPSWIATMYGGEDIRSHSNIVFRKNAIVAAPVPSELAWFLTVLHQRDSRFSPKRGCLLGFEVEVSLGH
ncbi:hypothetical protein STEG23_005571, partial [Scotinomys teguina]